LATFKRYDLCLFSSAAIPLAVFCPRPFVIIPTGGDINLTPFAETVPGFMTRAAYLRADGIFSLGFYAATIERLGLQSKTVYLPLVNSAPELKEDRAEIEKIRAAWQKGPGPAFCVLGACRQNWRWKGNDILLRAFAGLDWPEARLILINWGQDLDKTKELVRDLNLSDRVIWEPVSSRPRLRQKMMAADVVCDEFVMSGFGTAIVESLLAGAPVVSYPTPPDYFKGQPPPPILIADDAETITRHLASLRDETMRCDLKAKSRNWAIQERYAPRLAAAMIDNVLKIINARL
jgi:glycosyltransferase involved in cell wall biosynthesis